MPNPNQVNCIKIVEDYYNKWANAAGQPIGYFDSNSVWNSVKEAVDSASIGSSKKGNSNNKPGKLGSSSNYITNSDSNRNVGSFLDQQREDAFSGLTEGNLTNGLDGDGFASLDRGKMEALFRKLRSIANVYLLLAQCEDTKEESQERLNQAFTESQQPQNRGTWSEGAIKSNQEMMKSFQKGVMALVKRVDAHNNKIYKEKKAEIESWRDDTGSQIENWIMCGNKEGEEAKEMKQLSDDYAKAKQRSLDTIHHLKGMAQGINSGIQAKANNTMGDLLDDGGYTTHTSNGYIDMNQSMDALTDIRKLLVGLVNANRMIASSHSTKQEARGAMEEVIDGKKSGSNKFKTIEEIVEAESTQSMSLFDSIKMDILNKQKFINHKKYFQFQVEKYERGWVSRLFSRICTAISFICSIVALFVPWFAAIAAAFAVGAAVLDYCAALYADGVNDEYNPSVRNDTRSGDASAGMVSTIEDIGRGIKGDVGFSQLDLDNEGMYQINQAELARMQRTLNSVNAALLIIQKAVSQRGKVLNAIQRASSGLRGASGSAEVFEAGAQAAIEQSGAEFGALTFQLSEFKEGHNLERQQEIAMEEATTAFTWSIIIGAAGAAIGGAFGGAGAAIGSQLGMALGSAAAEMYNSYENGAYMMPEYEPDTSDFDNPQDGKLSKDLGVKLGSVEAGIYDDLLSNGIIGIGDNQYGLNADKIAALQTKLMRLMNTLATIITAQELKSELLGNISEAYGNTTVKKSSDMNRVNNHFASSFRVFNYLKQLLTEKVQVKNRIAAAETRVEDALTKFLVNAAIAVIASTVAAIASSAATTIMSIANMLMTAFNLAYDIYRSLKKATEDYGDLENYSVREGDKAKKDAVKRLGDAANASDPAKSTEQDIMRRLDLKEAQLYLDGSLLEDRSNGTIGINQGELALAVAKSTGIYRTRAILSGAMKQIQACLAMVQRATSDVRYPSNASLTAFDVANYQTKVMTESILQTQIQALQSVSSRHNQMSEAMRNAIVGFVKLGIVVVQAIISHASNDSPFSKDQQMALETKQAAFDKMKIKDPTKGLTNQEKLKLEQLQKHNAKPTKLKLVCMTALQLTQTISDWAVGAIVDGARESDDAGKKGEQLSESRKSLTKSVKDAKSYEQGVGAMEAAALSDELMGGNFGLNIQDINYDKVRAKEGMDGIKSLSKSLIMKAIQLYKYSMQDDRTTLMHRQKAKEVAEKIRGNQREISEALKRYNTQAPIALDRARKSAKAFQADNKSTQARSMAQMARADFIQASQPMLEHTEQLADTQAEVNKLRDQRESVVKEEHKTDPLRAKEDEKTAQIEKPDQEISSSKEIKKQIAELRRELKELSNVADPGQSFAKMQQIHSKMQQLQRSVSSAKVAADFSEASVTPSNVNKVQAEIDKEMATQLEKLTKDKSSKVKLEDLTKLQLKDLYRSLYKEIFKPARTRLQKNKGEQRLIKSALSKLPKEQHTQRTNLEAALLTLQNEEGEIRQRIQGFNRLVGNINRVYRTKSGKDLEPLKEINRPVPEGSGTIAPQVKAPAAAASRVSKPEEDAKIKRASAPEEAPAPSGAGQAKEEGFSFDKLENEFMAFVSRIDGVIDRLKGSVGQIKSASQRADALAREKNSA
ncbi:MAG: hypothetical protein HQ564_06675 [Candidatus Saganbacteria bacterium]|nr:hypothetical protein [Candidatus Saganbacteria bacterium]